MYLLFGCMFAIVLLSLLFCRYRRKRACERLRAMSCEERFQTLETIVSPFGYCYDVSQDCFSTTVNAPQRAFGYTALFDRYAPQFDMVFDCLPVYFDYRERTWLIEFWKGQYGVNLGCEVGVYKADGLIASLSRKTALFHSAEDDELLPMSVRLYHRGTLLAEKSGRHWWLTAFRVGAYCEPRDLEVQVGINFPNSEMLQAFVRALREYGDVRYAVCGQQVQILFRRGISYQYPFWRRVRCRYVQWKNKILCKLVVRMTKPFTCGMDRVLDLYFCLPRLIRRIFCQRKRERCCKKSGKCCYRGSCMCGENRSGCAGRGCRKGDRGCRKGDRGCRKGDRGCRNEERGRRCGGSCRKR